MGHLPGPAVGLPVAQHGLQKIAIIGPGPGAGHLHQPTHVGQVGPVPCAHPNSLAYQGGLEPIGEPLECGRGQLPGFPLGWESVGVGPPPGPCNHRIEKGAGLGQGVFEHGRPWGCAQPRIAASWWGVGRLVGSWRQLSGADPESVPFQLNKPARSALTVPLEGHAQVR